MKKMQSGDTARSLAERQHALDVDKWLESEAAGYDLCGSREFCASCDKAAQYPCALAEMQWNARNHAEAQPPEAPCEEPPAETLVREEAAIADAAGELPAPPEGYELVLRYRRSFRAKLIQNEEAQEFYSKLRNELSALEGVRARTCVASETFRLKKRMIARLALGRKTLVLYLALSPADYAGTKYRFTDVSDRKTYAETPMKLRITSNRACKYAAELLSDLAAKFSIARAEHFEMAYRFPYEDDKALAERGLIKPYYTLVKVRP